MTTLQTTVISLLCIFMCSACTSLTPEEEMAIGDAHSLPGRDSLTVPYRYRPIRSQRDRETPAHLNAEAGMLKDEELLEVAARVPPGLQEKVSVEQGARALEQLLDGRVGEVRIGHS